MGVQPQNRLTECKIQLNTDIAQAFTTGTSLGLLKAKEILQVYIH